MMEEKQLRKKQLRKEVLAAAAGLPGQYKKEADVKIVRLLLSLPGYRRAKTIFCFVGRGDEIDTLPFIEKALSDGKKVAVPLCLGKGIMEARLIKSVSELSPGFFGIPEPPSDSCKVEPFQIDMAVIPCAACSRDGRRLGYGGGYYDRYFETETKTVRNSILICREKLVREDIPLEPHDIIFPAVVTEAGVYSCFRRLQERV